MKLLGALQPPKIGLDMPMLLTLCPPGQCVEKRAFYRLI